MYDAVLFPTDGSDESLQALDHALSVANTYGATLHALYVVDTGSQRGVFDDTAVDLEPTAAALRGEGEQTLERIEQEAKHTGATFVGAVREGSVIHRTIRDYADENRVDLIVMATHGRRGLDRWLLGSVTERLVRTADVPVLTVRSMTDTEE